MKTPEPDVSNLKTGSFDVSKTSSKTSLSEIGEAYPRRHLDDFRLFTGHFNYLPNAIHEQKINTAKAHAWFVERHREDIREHYFSKVYFGESKLPRFDDCYYFLYEDLLVFFDIQQQRVRFLFKKTALAKVEELMAGIRKFKRRTGSRPELSLLVQSIHGITTKTLEISSFQFFYPNTNNPFWKVLASVAEVELQYFEGDEAIEERKSILDKLKLGITDMGYKILRHRNSSADNSIFAVEYMDIFQILDDHPTIEKMIFTSSSGSNSVEGWFRGYCELNGRYFPKLPGKNPKHAEFQHQDKPLEIVSVHSTSGAAGKGFEELLEMYRGEILN